ncbi:MAG: S8 family serine peptidase [Planctomycetes bacterium]|nr:S8 family serine peptidase [Planctomycetota bacterium]
MFTMPRGSCFLVSATLAAWLANVAPAQSSAVVVRTTSAGAELSFDGVQGFHTTANAVTSSKSFEVGAVRVAVWTERIGSSDVGYYAIRLADGSTHVKQSDYTVALRRAQFDPAVAAPDFSGSAIGWEGETYVVQFETQPLYEYQEALRAAGAIVYDYFPNHCHLVRMSAEVKAAVEQLPFVRWVGPFHGEYKLDAVSFAALESGALGEQRYYVQVFERGLAQKVLAAEKVRAIGGRIDVLDEHGFLFQATLSPAQLRKVLGFDEVAAIDPWGMAEPDMNNARIVSGANALETLAGFTGTGVRGEVMDGGVLATHVDLQHDGGITFHGATGTDWHGTATTGIVFGDGTSNAQARGVLPDGSIVSARYTNLLNFGGTTNRYVHTAELVNPLLPYRCVFQSNSWGSPQVTSYTTQSFEMDDMILINDILILNSQSNTNSTLSRPEAWAKNVVSIGGINHSDNLNKGDDFWNGASIGPAEDGRLKPDLSHFYDAIFTSDSGCSTCVQTGFGGTSGATPITAGHFGLFFEMWHNGFFGNPHPGATVFDNRPHFTLAKAAMINTATQYTFSGTNHNLTRTHQGWGVVNVQALHDRAPKTFWVNQTEVLDNLETATYPLDVGAGEPDLRVTLVYRDAPGTVSAAQHRKNDLSLKVTAPDGVTFYWGNNGLAAGNYSTTGGVANTKDTVENVLVRLPVAGTWTIQVIGSDVNTDMVSSEPGNNADFALWVTGATKPCPAPTAYCTPKLTSIGTLPTIASVGSPSFSQNNFSLTLANGTLNKAAIVFWGTGQQSASFHGGTLCVTAPFKRSTVLGTDGVGAASYQYVIDALDVGQTLNFQWWMRDPADPFTDGLSDALSVNFCN